MTSQARWNLSSIGPSRKEPIENIRKEEAGLKQNLGGDWRKLLFIALKPDQSDILRPAEPLGNSPRFPTGAKADI